MKYINVMSITCRIKAIIMKHYTSLWVMCITLIVGNSLFRYEMCIITSKSLLNPVFRKMSKNWDC